MGLKDTLTGWLGLQPDIHAPSQETTPSGNAWQKVGGQRIPLEDSFDNVFSYVTPIAQRFSSIIPYAISDQGERLDIVPAAMQSVYAPNDSFSSREFLQFIATSVLTQSHLDLLIWTKKGNKAIPGGDINPDNICGYTVLPTNSREYSADGYTYINKCKIFNEDGIPREETFTRNEVISLTFMRHPNDPSKGISPAMTISKWASVDDMIADYERGFFGNGAVPAGYISIISETDEDFNKNVAKLQQAFAGAGKNNGIFYNRRPIDPLTHKPMGDGKISFTPFQSENNSLDLTGVNTITNNRLAGAFAVPDIIRGIDNGQTYANAEQAKTSFIENTLQPLALTIWDKFQFELDRITGGLGYGITFDLPMPEQTDVKHIQAETQQTQINSLITLVNAGATVEDAATALGLPDEYKTLTLQKSVTQAPTFTREQTTKQDSSSDVQNRVNNSRTTITLATTGTSMDKALKQAREHVVDAYKKLIPLLGKQNNAQTDPVKTISLDLADKLLADYMPLILDYAKRTGQPLIEAMQEVAENDKQVADILAAYSAVDLVKLYDWESLPEEYADAYTEHLRNVTHNSVDSTSMALAEALQQAQDQGLTRDETEALLANIVDGERASLLATNEVVASEKLGSLYSARNMSETMGVEIEKVWNANGDDPCDFCLAMDGKVIGLDHSFMPLGSSMEINGTTYVNDFEDKQTTSGHPNCRCDMTYQVKGVKGND